MKIIFRILLLCCIYFPVNCYSQNLIRNPGFEDTLGCPNESGQVGKCAWWEAVCNTPDYFNSCNKNLYGVPMNEWGYQSTNNGKAYIGMITYSALSKNQREIIESKLISPLIKGKKYYLSLKYNRANSTKFATNRLGVSFSTAHIEKNLNLNKIIYKDHSNLNSNIVNGDTISWKIIQGSFYADSNYLYILIGNFFSDSLISIGDINSNYFDWSYYYVDDICLSEDSLTCFNQVSIKENKRKSINVYPNPFTKALYIHSEDGLSKSLTLYNSTSEIFTKVIDNEEYELDLEYLPNGIYFYVIKDDFGLIITGKLVKL